MKGKDALNMGFSVYGGGVVYSLVDTHFAVKRAKKRANDQATTQHMGFSPQLLPSMDGGLKPGMIAWATF